MKIVAETLIQRPFEIGFRSAPGKWQEDLLAQFPGTYQPFGVNPVDL